MAKVMKRVREQKGYSVRMLADEVGVHYSSISLWEHGKRKPRNGNIYRLEKVLGVSINKLMEDDDNEE